MFDGVSVLTSAPNNLYLSGPEDLGFRAQGLGFRVQCSGLRV